MNCFKAQIPDHLQSVKDELKAMYQSKDSICIWIFKTVSERNKFMDETIGMLKEERDNHYMNNYK